MNVIFHLDYQTRFGEQIYLVTAAGERLPMQYTSFGHWMASTQIGGGESYHYECCYAGGGARVEAQNHIVPKSKLSNIELFDAWWDVPAEQPFYSSLFSDVVFAHTAAKKACQPVKGKVLVQVEAPLVQKSESLAIVGESMLLGGWDTTKAVPMQYVGDCVWEVLLPIDVLSTEYKFISLNEDGSLSYFEDGDNRRMPSTVSEAVVVRGLRMRHAMGWKGAGVAIPVFSLRSSGDWGCGEFYDLKQMGEWAASVGMSVIQLLPINDTSLTWTWKDSYPYNALSSFALHPIYINAAAVAKVAESYLDAAAKRKVKALLKECSAEGAALNALDVVDYDATIALKNRLLHGVFDLCGEKFLASKEYQAFFAENKDWLLPYVVFCVLRDTYKTVHFSKWKKLSTFKLRSVEKFAKENAMAVGYYGFVQYMLDRQLCEVRDYIHSLGVGFKGDIPIGVSPVSVDVWCAPELYNCGMSAGAPPDAFAADGQNWGFPTYNWDKMAEDGYLWWRRRLQKMACYFDAYRIDHILGFFRIWEVPLDAVSAILGHFNPSMPYTADEVRSFGFESWFDVDYYSAKNHSSANVLLLEYPNMPGRYFPRIEGYKTEKFNELTEQSKQAYMRMHDDFYYRRHNDFWGDNARRRLPALLSASKMLTCGEDLGMIPACVADVMSEQRILSLEIERMPKDVGVDFGNMYAYPYFSVAASSTHDMSPIRGWWSEESGELRNNYWWHQLCYEGYPPQDCPGWLACDIVRRHMRSGSMLAILPLQDWMAIDETLRRADAAAERINVPANPNHYWRYRMHLSLEDLLAAVDFNKQVGWLVEERRK